MQRISGRTFLARLQCGGDSNRRIGIECVSLADFIKLIRGPCYARPCVITIAETLRGIRGSWKSCAFRGLDAPLFGFRYALVKKTDRSDEQLYIYFFLVHAATDKFFGEIASEFFKISRAARNVSL